MTKSTPQSKKEEATKAILDRVATGVSFTYAQLHEIVDALGANEARDRIADRTIQSWRRKGFIAFTREGRSVIWNLTEAGHAQVALLNDASETTADRPSSP